MPKKDLLVGLRNNEAVLKSLVEAIEPEAIERRIKDYWTIREHLEHLVVTQRMLLGRMGQFLAEERPVMKPYIPEDRPAASDSKRGAAELVEEFVGLREKQVALAKRAGRAVWAKEGVHPEYRKYGFEILLRHTLLHDSFHMWRMEELWIEKEELIKELH